MVLGVKLREGTKSYRRYPYGSKQVSMNHQSQGGKEAARVEVRPSGFNRVKSPGQRRGGGPGRPRLSIRDRFHGPKVMGEDRANYLNSKQPTENAHRRNGQLCRARGIRKKTKSNQSSSERVRRERKGESNQTSYKAAPARRKSKSFWNGKP